MWTVFGSPHRPSRLHSPRASVGDRLVPGGDRDGGARPGAVQRLDGVAVDEIGEGHALSGIAEMAIGEILNEITLLPVLHGEKMPAGG